MPTPRPIQAASWRSSPDRPLVGVTPDVFDRSNRRTQGVSSAYLDRIFRAGGVPIVLTAHAELVHEHARLCDAFVLTGGDDPRTEPFGQPSDPRITPVFQERQAYETELLRILLGEAANEHPAPVLGICLGMQMMALVAGGALDQHLPATTPTHADHLGRDHELIAEQRHGPLPARGTVHSHHRQAVRDPGRLRVLARAHDGVIEAIGDPRRPFVLGVQWHPERTEDAALGQSLFDRLIAEARARS